MRGMRRARAPRTADDRRVAYCSRAAPPDSINTTIEATRYSPRITAVTIEIPAIRSEPKSRAMRRLERLTRSGRPPMTSTAYKGARYHAGVSLNANRTARCSKIADVVKTAIQTSMRLQRRALDGPSGVYDSEPPDPSEAGALFGRLVVFIFAQVWRCQQTPEAS